MIIVSRYVRSHACDSFVFIIFDIFHVVHLKRVDDTVCQLASITKFTSLLPSEKEKLDKRTQSEI